MRWSIFVRPGGVYLTGGDIGDIIPEGHGHVAGRGGRFAQMHRDVFGNDHLVQHTRRAVFHRLCAAAAVSGKQGVGGDDHRGFRDVPAFLGVRDQFRLGQRDLSGKDLHTLDAYGAVTGFGSGQAAHGIGPHGGIGFVQRIGAGRGVDGHIRGIALGVGGVLYGKAIAAHGEHDALHGGGLAGPEGLQA